MEKNGTINLVDQFQDAFARVFENQIHQLIEDSRLEALAQAKQILRENALHNVLEAVISGTTDADSEPIQNVAELQVQPLRIKATPEEATTPLGPRPEVIKTAPPVLNDRILEEIEAIREQIQRNELLLSKIKPFVRTSQVQKE